MACVARWTISAQLGDEQFDIIHFEERRGEEYAIPRTPTGLHISKHRTGKTHIRDNHGFRESIGPEDSDSWEAALQEWFGYSPPDDAVMKAIILAGDPGRYVDLDMNDQQVTFQVFTESDIDRAVLVEASDYDVFLDSLGSRAAMIVDEDGGRTISTGPVEEQGRITIAVPILFNIEERRIEAHASPGNVVLPFIEGLQAAEETTEEKGLPVKESLQPSEDAVGFLLDWMTMLQDIFEDADRWEAGR